MMTDCYNFLISNFGHIDIKGSLYIAELVDFNITSNQFKYAIAYDMLAEKYDTNAGAIERSIRHYITTIVNDSSLATVCDKLDYPVPNNDTLKISEFIPLLKKKLTVNIQE